MTAPDQYCINVKKLLSIRRRPHMTQSGHGPDRNPAVQLTFAKCAILWSQAREMPSATTRLLALREDDMRSLVFETRPLHTPIELLGAAIATFLQF